MSALTIPTEQMQDGLGELSRLAFLSERQQLRDSLHAFVKAAWHIIEPGKVFVDNWHIELLCEELENVYYGRCKRLVINVPPGSLKSIIVSVFFPVWVWVHNPRKRFLCAAYQQNLSTRDAQRARDLIESAWFQARWNITLADDQNAKTRYNTNLKGWRISTSIDGVGTGEHPDYILIDDPTSASQAQSDAEREAANAWFDNTASQRLGRNPAIIVCMQRLHKKDMTAHVTAKAPGVWRMFVLPMRYEVCTCPQDLKDLRAEGRSIPTDRADLCPNHKDNPAWLPHPKDPRTQAGELLCSEAYPEEQVRDRELNLGPHGAAAQLQQRPSAEGGGLFRRAWFKFLDARPKHITRSVRGYDTAATDGGGDWSVGVRIDELPDGTWVVSDVWREQVGPAGLDKAMRTNAELDTKSTVVREEKEGGSAGKSVGEARAKHLRGYDYKCVTITGAKPVRVGPFRAQVEAGNVFLVRAGWNEAFIQELCDFPVGDHDDQADAAGCAFNAILLEPKRNPLGAVW